MHEGMLTLVRAAATADAPETLLRIALPVLAATYGAGTLLLTTRRGDVLAHAGDATHDHDHDRDQEREQHAVDDDLLVLVRRPGGGPTVADDEHEVAVASLVAGLRRLAAVRAHAELGTRVEEVQSLAGLGDFDWDITRDTVRWSDEMYRIFGHAPGAFEPTYAAFAAGLHPDDRERIQQVHQEAYRTGEPFAMTGRVCRPDGTVRHVATRGEVLQDATGTPVRMRGTSLDVTDRVRAEHERERSAARFRGLVDASPRAILLVDSAGTVVEANSRAHQMLAGDAVGMPAAALLPELRSALGLTVTRVDGTALVADVLIAPLPHAGEGDEESMDVVFVEDASPRLDREALTTRLGEARLRRRQALEINDNVVQGLVAASYALDAERYPVVATYIAHTLEAARSMMNDLLEPLAGEDLAPGDLVRSRPADITAPRTLPVPGPTGARTGATRVLLVDDADDLRLLTRHVLERVDGLTVVGEANDGIAGVEQAAALQPDLVVLDMAMPRMDGLQALPRIKAAVPGVRVVVFSGFDEAVLAEKAVAAGADGYAAKGGSMTALVDTVAAALRAG